MEAVAAKAKARLLLPFFLILISVTAYSISSTDYTVRLGSVSSEVSVNLVLDNQYPMDKLAFPIPGQVLEVVAKVDGQEVGWSIEGSQLVMDYQKPAGINYVNITYYTDLVTYSERGYLFSFTHPSSTPTKFVLKIFLPAHAVVSRGMPLTPEPRISSDGENIILSWEKQLASGESFSAVGMYSSVSQDWSLFLVIGVLGVIVVSGAVLFFRYRKKSDKKVLMVLSEDERKVYQKVKETPGITQKEVEVFTGFSKAKLSKLVRNLEQSKILEKQPHRKTNKLWPK